MKMKIEFCPIEIVELIHLCDQELQARKKGIRKQGFCGDSSVLFGCLEKLITKEAEETGKALRTIPLAADFNKLMHKYADHLMKGMEVLK